MISTSIKREFKTSSPMTKLVVQPDPITESVDLTKTSVTLIRGKGTAASDLPPQLSCVPMINHTFRFVSNSANLTTVDVGSIMGMLGVIGTTATTVTTVASSFRLKSLKVWPPAGNNAFIEWNSAEGYVRDEIKDSSVPSGITVTKSLSFYPPKKSLLSNWVCDQIPGTHIFNIYAPSGSIIDVKVVYTLSGAIAPETIGVTSAAVNSFYYLALDGPTNHRYVPVALPTTF
jgi:hypothetical protein